MPPSWPSLCAIQSNSSPLSKSPLLLPLPIPFILLLQHDAVHTRLEQRKRQARLPLQLAQSVPNLERRTRCQLVQFACQLFIYISRAYCYLVAFLTCAFYWGFLSLGTKKKRLAPESFRTCIYVCVCITQTEERRSIYLPCSYYSPTAHTPPGPESPVAIIQAATACSCPSFSNGCLLLLLCFNSGLEGKE